MEREARTAQACGRLERMREAFDKFLTLMDEKAKYVLMLMQRQKFYARAAACRRSRARESAAAVPAGPQSGDTRTSPF